jgi:uncharacterized protein (TIGR02118 family)
MVKVSVLYPNREGTKFDMAYYLNRHIPMVEQLLGSALKGVSVEQGVSGEEPGSPAPYIAKDTFCSIQWTFFTRASARMRRRSWKTSRSTRTQSQQSRSAK